jgi:NAD(P)-dependent dehydrogenase (short-subunit alcohol dehydrogenase family)
MIEAVIADFGRIDILVHSAGIASRGRSVVDTDPTEPMRLFATHAQGGHHLAALALPYMRKNPRGDVVVISSVATLGHAANGAPYNMAKAALEALALTLAKEEKAHGIYVNIVAPGLVDTDMGQRLAKAAMGAPDIHMLDERMPFGHVCQPEEVANVVRFLVSPANTYVTGEKLNVHGGGQR